MGEVTEQYPVAKWKVGNAGEIAFPVGEITETGGNRIVPHERPGRDGAKLDDTGSKPRQWSFTAMFGNRLEEPGVTGVLFPDVLRSLLRSFVEHETGTLTLPTIGDVRARAETYTRHDSPEEDDYATVELVFTQDNEDALDVAQLKPPSVVATIIRLAEQTQFSAQKAGAWNDDFASLTEIASNIQGLVLAPGRSVADLGAVTRSHRRTLQSLATIGDTATAESQPNDLSDPRSSDTQRQLRIMIDREAQAEEERTQSRPRTKAFVVDVERTSIFEVAARLNQDAEALMDLNTARVDDPFLLTRGQVIRVFESAA